MPVNRPLRGFLGCALLLVGFNAQAWAKTPQDAGRSPIEFRLHHPVASASMDVDIWAPVDPGVVLETQQDLQAIRQSALPPADPRQSFGDVLLAGLATLPVAGQFANHDWLKGLVTLGTAAGLTTAIVLGSERNNPQLVRLGTLGLYPLAVFGAVDAFVTRQQRDAKPTSPP
ncbi:hypothetical protein D3C87_1557030 [compost metagenome]